MKFQLLINTQGNKDGGETYSIVVKSAGPEAELLNLFPRPAAY